MKNGNEPNGNEQGFELIQVNPKGDFEVSKFFIKAQDFERTNLRIARSTAENERVLSKSFDAAAHMYTGC